MKSDIPEDLIAAYRETHYRVMGEISTLPTNPLANCTLAFTLRVGQKSDDLLTLYPRLHCASAVFVAAVNPYSRATEPQINTMLHQRLLADLRTHRKTFIEGMGEHPSKDWPAEPSVLAFDYSLEDAKQLGRDYEQNAIVYCGASGVAELISLR